MAKQHVGACYCRLHAFRVVLLHMHVHSFQHLSDVLIFLTATTSAPPSYEDTDPPPSYAETVGPPQSMPEMDPSAPPIFEDTNPPPSYDETVGPPQSMREVDPLDSFAPGYPYFDCPSQRLVSGQ